MGKLKKATIASAWQTHEQIAQRLHQLRRVKSAEMYRRLKAFGPIFEPCSAEMENRLRSTAEDGDVRTKNIQDTNIRASLSVSQGTCQSMLNAGRSVMK